MQLIETSSKSSSKDLTILRVFEQGCLVCSTFFFIWVCFEVDGQGASEGADAVTQYFSYREFSCESHGDAAVDGVVVYRAVAK